ncbi:hypothetical protein C3488_35145 [Streptomyces sp. Ru72]|nr:hypothetical protein C3488_35145 [Streptomyces sp. Ru72]
MIGRRSDADRSPGSISAELRPSTSARQPTLRVTIQGTPSGVRERKTPVPADFSDRCSSGSEPWSGKFLSGSPFVCDHF